MDSLFFKEYSFKNSIFSQPARSVLKASVQLEFIGAGSNMEPLGLFRSYLPHSNSELCTVFFMNSLLFKEYSVKFSNFFSTSSTDLESFSSVRVHWSMSKFRAFGIVSIISPSSKLGIAYYFFYGLLILQGIFCQTLKFFLNWLNQFEIGSTGSLG